MVAERIDLVGCRRRHRTDREAMIDAIPRHQVVGGGRAGHTKAGQTVELAESFDVHRLCRRAVIASTSECFALSPPGSLAHLSHKRFARDTSICPANQLY